MSSTVGIPEIDFPKEFEALVQLVWLRVPLSSASQADIRTLLNALMTAWRDENVVASAFDKLSFEVTQKRAVDELEAHIKASVAARKVSP